MLILCFKRCIHDFAREKLLYERGGVYDPEIERKLANTERFLYETLEEQLKTIADKIAMYERRLHNVEDKAYKMDHISHTNGAPVYTYA